MQYRKGRRDSAGFRRRAAPRRPRAGVTLIEMLVVVTLIGLAASIAYPTAIGGLSAIRLRGAVEQAQTFFLQAKQYADRRQEVVQLTIDPEGNRLRALSETGAWLETLEFADGVAVAGLEEAHSVILFPGSPAPAFALMLDSGEGERLGFRMNFLTGLPEEWEADE